MPIKNQRTQHADSTHMRDRTNTVTTTASKQTAATSKKISAGVTQHRPISGGTGINSAATSLLLATNMQQKFELYPRKIITEVNDTNIDEVLSLSDMSLIPKTFLKEIQRDEVYSTIVEVLRKKMKLPDPSKTPQKKLEENHEQEQKPFSPHLLAIQDDDDVDDDDDDNSDDENNDSTTEDANDDGDRDDYEDDEDETSINDDDMMSTAGFSEVRITNSHEDYKTDIDSESTVSIVHDPTGKENYRELCKQAKVIPCSYFMAHIQDNELLLRYHQFSTDDIRAITKTLSTNINVERLFLDGNYLQEQAAKHITQLILTNDSITELSLADNRIGGNEGTKEVCRMLTLNRNLKKINLSGNKFNELDIIQLITAFEQNKILRELDLSHNCFGEECGKAVGAFISSNDSLEAINLGWNKFRGRSAIDLLIGIKENIRLKRCNLEMNGLGPDSGQVIADCIKQNSALEEFNISGNRLNTQNAFAIAQALSSNDSLEVLRIGNNQINSDGVLAVFLCIKANEVNSLREVDFSQTVVTEEVEEVCKDIVNLKNGKFMYHIGKATSKKLQPNSTSECYVKTNEELLKKMRSTAANVKPSTD